MPWISARAARAWEFGARFARIAAVRILHLAQRVPYPPNRGDKITTWRDIEYLSRTHEVVSVAFAHDDGDRAAAAELRTRGFEVHTVDLDLRRAKLRALPLLLTKQPLTLGVYGSAKLQAIVDRLMPSIDVAIAFSSSMGAFLLPHVDTPRIQFVVELDSDKWAQYAPLTSWPLSLVYRREARCLLAFERRLCAAMDMNLLVTELELRIFEERIPNTVSCVMPNGVDLERFHPRANAPEAGHFVFTGVMDYFPNVDGCVWFAREILPRIRERCPDAHFTIVGSSPTPEVAALARLDGVTVTGFVPETCDFLARAAVAVAPLRIARGIQNKVLEAMAMGLAVVGTTHATQGVGGQTGRDYLVADDADTFAAACTRLLLAPADAAALGAQARVFVEQHYDWERVLAPLGELVLRIGAKEPGRPNLD